MLQSGELEPLEVHVVQEANRSVSLACELYGYVDGALNITWQLAVVTTESVYTITEDIGGHMIQNGGDSPRPSVKSSLTIELLLHSQAGIYTCLGGGMNKTIILETGMCILYQQWWANDVCHLRSVHL